jgi:hypothetical protein
MTLITEEVHIHNWSESNSVDVAKELDKLYNSGKGETHIKSLGRAVFLQNQNLAELLRTELVYWVPDEKT